MSHLDTTLSDTLAHDDLGELVAAPLGSTATLHGISSQVTPINAINHSGLNGRCKTALKAMRNQADMSSQFVRFPEIHTSEHGQF